MVRRPGLSKNDRYIALGLLQAGTSAAAVSRRLGCHERTIHRLQARFRETGSTDDKARSGRPRKTTPREDRFIVRSSRGKPFFVRSKSC